MLTLINIYVLIGILVAFFNYAFTWLFPAPSVSYIEFTLWVLLWPLIVMIWIGTYFK